MPQLPSASRRHVFKSRSQILRPLSPVLDAVARMLRPSTTLPKASWADDDAAVQPVDAFGPAAPEPPTTPDDHIVPISPSPSTCGSTSDSSLPNWTPDRGVIKRRRLERYVEPKLEAQVHYRREMPPSAPRGCTVLENIVLELYDVQRVDWMMIAEPLQRLYGLEVTSAGVLSILQTHGRIQKTDWWD